MGRRFFEQTGPTKVVWRSRDLYSNHALARETLAKASPLSELHGLICERKITMMWNLRALEELMCGYYSAPVSSWTGSQLGAGFGDGVSPEREHPETQIPVLPGLNFHRTQPNPSAWDSRPPKTDPRQPISCLTLHLLVTAWNLPHTLGSFLPLGYCVFYAQCLKCPPTLLFLSWRTTQP